MQRSGSRVYVGAAVVAVVVSAAAASGLAQPDASDAVRRQASEHVERGDIFKKQGKYRAAAREYDKAYELVPHPVLFFNLGQVYRLDGDGRRALAYYRRYLAADPDGVASRQAERYIDELNDELERKDAARGSGVEASPGEPAGAGADLSADLGSSHPGGGEGRWLRYGGLAAAGGGLVSIGLGIKYGLDARRFSDEISGQTERWPNGIRDLEAKGERSERNMFIFTGIGAAAVVGGGLLFYLSYRSRSSRSDAEDRIVIAPGVSGDQLGAVLSGRF